MKLLIVCLFSIFSLCAIAQTTPLSFTAIASSPDLITPDRGAEGWNGRTWDNGVGGAIKIPTGNVTRYSDYYRFLWAADIEQGAQGTYSWTAFDTQIHAAIDSGRIFNFGIMEMCSACGYTDHGVSGLTYPQYLHNLMQAEATNSQDWQVPSGDAAGLWVPNWNSPNFLARWKALLVAVANHIATTSYSGHTYASVIGYVDIRGYGDFGEWHNYPYYTLQPTGRTATQATLDTIMNYNVQNFPSYPNVILQGAYDPSNASQTPSQTSYYALTLTNAWGPVGWRRDNWGDPGDSVILDKNPGSYNPGTGVVQFAPIISAKYKTAPVVGEPDLTSSNFNCGSILCDMPREISLYGAMSFGNGNYATDGDAGTEANAIQSSRNSGYRLAPTGGSMSTTLSIGSAFALTVNWQNTGAAPTYWNWNVVYQLRNSGGSTVASWTSIFNPKLFLPSGTATSETDNFVVPSTGVSAGTGYSLYVIFQDPGAYKKPLSLAITGRGSDGAYLIRSGITVGAGGPPFNVNAGADQTLVSTATSTTLSGILPTDSNTLIVIQGESNAAGNALNTQAQAFELASRPSVQILNHPSNAFLNLQVPINSQQNSFFGDTVHGFDLDLANIVDSGFFATKPVHLCKIGISGGYICQWQPGGCAPAGGGSVFDAWDGYMPYMDSAVSKMKQLGKPFRIAIWQSIGLNDRFGQGTNPTTFQSEMGTYRANVRARYSRPDIQFLSTNFNNPPGPNLPAGQGLTWDWSYIWTNMANADPLFHNIPVIGATYRDGSSHWDYYGMKLIAHNMTDTMLFAPGIQMGIGGTYTVSWSKVSGPSNVTFGASTSKTTTVSGLIVGGYTFRMTVTDSLGTVQTDDINVNVGGSTPTGPTAIASATTPIQLPTSTTTLNGMASTDPGTITGYAWSNVSGPNTPTITSSTGSTTTVTGLIAGTYVFGLTVTDNNSLTNSTTVTVMVNPAPATGLNIFTTQTPVSGTLGPDQSGGITTGVKFRSTVSGYVSGVRFYQTSGNSGTHVGGLYSYPAGVQLTTATYSGETGSGWQTVTFGSTIPINANTTYIATYFGASGFYVADNDLGTGLSLASAVTNAPLTALAGGTDGVNGLFSYSNSTVLPTSSYHNGNYWVDVIFAANQPPNAVINGPSVVQSPITQTALFGNSSSDPDGTIASYLWTNISGPNTPTLSTPITVNTAISGLIIGTYVFQLQVTDNFGAVGTVQKTIIVQRGPTSFPIGSGAPGSSVSLTSMTGHQFGDTAKVTTLTSGVYASLTLKDLQGIIVVPQDPSRPAIFSTTSTMCRLISVKLLGHFQFISAGNSVAIDNTCGRLDSCLVDSAYFQGWSSSIFNASGNITYVFGTDSTYHWFNDTIRNCITYQCNRLVQGSFGTQPISNTDVARGVHIYQNQFIATSSTSFEPIQYTGVCYNCYLDHSVAASITQRGASGDCGVVSGSGLWHIHDNYMSGGPGYLGRIFPMKEPRDGADSITAYNNGKFNGKEYGMFNLQYYSTDTLTGQRIACGAGLWNNTMGNQFNDTLGYWSTMFNLGASAPNCHYYVKNNFAFNVGNNTQSAGANGAPNNNKPQMAYNLGGWNTIGQDTSNNKYWPYATVAILDSITTLITNALGNFPAFYLTTNSPNLRNAGLTSPLATKDYSGHIYATPPDLGYLQFNSAIFAPKSYISGLKKGVPKHFLLR